MLYSKLQFMVIMSAEIGTDTTRVKRSSVAAMVCFTLLVAVVPYVLSNEVKLEPASWAGFVGLGLGALLPDLR